MHALHEQQLTEREFKTVRSLIYQYAGIALSDYKQVMVQGRLSKRMRKLNIVSYAEYLDYVQRPGNQDEVVAFINALTTNKTDFFREAHHFDFLAKHVFPEAVRRAERTGERKLRIWCSASSTGEEPYTIAMAIREFFGPATGWDIRVLASDIDTEVLKAAENGIYHVDRVQDLSPDLLKRYFDREGKQENASYIARDFIRELITFRRINLHDQQWPINTTFDVIFCRNVMIYFDAPSQQKIIEHFGRYLRQDGYLMLGHSESIFALSDQFKLLGETVYQKLTPTSKPTAPTNNGIRQSNKTVSPGPFVHRNESGTKVAANKTNDPYSKHSIIIGEVFVSEKPTWISTVLGSCVAVCLYDEDVGIGGMNHFMLPTPNDDTVICNRYGIHSMELLINSLMKKGADRRRLKAKVFGGCNVVRNSFASIGSSNVDFAFNFLKTEGIPVVSSCTNQDVGMSVEFHTHSSKVLVRLLDRQATEKVEHQEKRLAPSVLSNLERHQDVILFDRGIS